MTDPIKFDPDWYDPKMVETYVETAKALRRLYEQVTEGTGKRGRGPAFIAVTMCDECHGIGLTSSKAPQRTRFKCKTCDGPAIVVWADGKVPTEDEQYEMWAKGKNMATKKKDHGEGALHHIPRAMDGLPHACQAVGHGDFIVPQDAPRWKIKATGQHLCRTHRDLWVEKYPDVRITGGDPFQ
jgi:hypothetical protein